MCEYVKLFVSVRPSTLCLKIVKVCFNAGSYDFR